MSIVLSLFYICSGFKDGLIFWKRVGDLVIELDDSLPVFPAGFAVTCLAAVPLFKSQLSMDAFVLHFSPYFLALQGATWLTERSFLSFEFRVYCCVLNRFTTGASN